MPAVFSTRLDGSGVLEKDEVLAIPNVASNPLVSRLMAVFDNDGSGDIDFKEFIAGLSAFSSKGKAEEKLKCNIHKFMYPSCIQCI